MEEKKKDDEGNPIMQFPEHGQKIVFHYKDVLEILAQEGSTLSS